MSIKIYSSTINQNMFEYWIAATKAISRKQLTFAFGSSPRCWPIHLEADDYHVA